jgi:hypothetical protein
MPSMPEGLSKMAQMKWKRGNKVALAALVATGSGAASGPSTTENAAPEDRPPGEAAPAPAPAAPASGHDTGHNMPEGLSKLEQIKVSSVSIVECDRWNCSSFFVSVGHVPAALFESSHA